MVYSDINLGSGKVANKADLSSYDFRAAEKERINLGTQNIKKDLIEKWNKEYRNEKIFSDALSGVNQAVMNFLLAINLVDVYDGLAKKGGLNEEQRNLLPQIIWQIAQKKNWDNAEKEVREKIGTITDEKTFFDALNFEIIRKGKEYSLKSVPAQAGFRMKKEEKNKLQAPLLQAMEKYMHIGEQIVTANLLKMKYSPDLMKPSIKNWIKNYHEIVGGGKHGSMERVNFLFHSENGKKLNSVERQKLTILLKSLEENLPLEIDPEKQIVVFDLVPEKEPERKMPIAPMQNSPVMNQTSSQNVGTLKTVTHKHTIFSQPVQDSMHNFQGAGTHQGGIISKPQPIILKNPQTQTQTPIKKNIAREESMERLKNFAPKENKNFADMVQKEPLPAIEKPTETPIKKSLSDLYGRFAISSFDKEIESKRKSDYEFNKKERDYGFKAPDFSEMEKNISKKSEEKKAKGDNSETQFIAEEDILDKKVGVGSENYFENFSSNNNIEIEENSEAQKTFADESVRFSSPQKTQMEKSFSSGQKSQVQAATQVKNKFQSQPQQLSQFKSEPQLKKAKKVYTRSPFRITPVSDDYNFEDKLFEQYQDKSDKKSGNVVNLRT